MGIAKALRGRLEQVPPPPARRGAGAISSESRMAVYKVVVERPCSSVREVSRKTGRGETAVRWHVGRLAKAGLLSFDRCGESGARGRRSLAPRNLYSAGMLEFLSVLNGPSGGLLVKVGRSPGAKASELCDGNGNGGHPAAKALAQLCSAGYLRCVRDGRTMRYFPGESTVAARAESRAEARASRDRLVEILQREVPGLVSVSGRGARVVAECPWGVETFNLPFMLL